MNLKIDHLKSAVKLNLYFISDPQICLLFDFVYQCVFYMNSDYRTIAPYQSLERNHLFKRFQKYNLCVISWSERLCPSLLKIQNSTWHAEKNSRRMSVKHGYRAASAGGFEGGSSGARQCHVTMLCRPSCCLFAAGLSDTSRCCFILTDRRIDHQSISRSTNDALKIFFTKHPNCASLVSTHGRNKISSLR